MKYKFYNMICMIELQIYQSFLYIQKIIQSIQLIRYKHQSRMQNIYNSFSNSQCLYLSAAYQYYTFIPITPATSESSFQTFENSTSQIFCFNPLPMEPKKVNQDLSSPPFLYQKAVGRQNVILKSSQMMQEYEDKRLNTNENLKESKSLRRQCGKKQKQSYKQNVAKITISNPKQKIIQFMIKEEINYDQDDNQYLPWVEKKNKPANKYQENQNRNIIPNEINQIFSFIGKKAKSGHLVEKLFIKYPHPHSFSPKRYYLYQALLKDKLGHYSNEKSLKVITQLYQPKCESWAQQEQRYYNKISRILIHHFLYQDSIFIILTSKRMKSEKKHAHLSARRYLANQVLSIIKGY